MGTWKRDWDFVEQLVGGDVDDLRAEALAIAPGRQRLEEVGLLFQDKVYALVRFTEPEVVVETGVRTGVATRMIMEALRAAGDGRLLSCDPMHQKESLARSKMTEALGPLPEVPWMFWPEKSITALVKMATECPEWHVFLHDSEHTFECQYFELEMAWRMVPPGGLVICDDWDFPLDSTRNETFQRWLEAHPEIKVGGFIGTAAVVVKDLKDPGGTPKLVLSEPAEDPAKAAVRKRDEAIRATAVAMRAVGREPTYEQYLTK
jgi:predicted O-methyltransferase YrrM